MIIGVDPGHQGGVACLDPVLGRLLWVEDMPTTPKTSGKGQEVNEDGVRVLLSRETDVTCVVVEQATYRPPRRRGELVQGGAGSAFVFGLGFGIVRGVAAGLGYRRELVLPNDWKRRMGLTGKDKGASRALASREFPGLADRFLRVKDDGRAEAALIALDYLRRQGGPRGPRHVTGVFIDEATPPSLEDIL